MSIFKISNWLKKKHSISFFRHSAFHQIIKITLILLFNNYVQIGLTIVDQQWLSFHFRLDHFTIAFIDSLINQTMNLLWLSLFLCLHDLNFLILLYYGFDCFFFLIFCYIVFLSLKFSRVKLSKNDLDFLVW